MPDHGIATNVGRDEGSDGANYQRPVNDPRRQIPDSKARYQTTASCFSTLTWMNCSRETPIHITSGLATRTEE